MATCLGIYIDNNIIKYAKVTKKKEDLKIDAYGIKFYSDLQEAIKQVVSETFSFKIPISVNLSDEMYNTFNMSSLLSKKDLGKAIETEFESLCYEKQYNPNALESRYSLVNDANDKDKIKVIHISTNKTKINKVLQDFEGEMVGTIAPISLSIANIAPLKQKENILIVNMEDKTTVTTIIGQKVYDVVTLEENGKKYIKVIIAHGSEGPYYIKGMGMTPDSCFIRVGSSIQSMPYDMINNRVNKRTRTSLRNIVSPKQNLTFSQLKIYYEEKGFNINNNFLKQLDLYTDDGKYNYNAYLLADNNTVSIKFGKYAGTNAVDLIENEDFGNCSLIKATKNILNKIEIENKIFTKIEYPERKEI